jgi:dihydroflavonol-4-reductase
MTAFVTGVSGFIGSHLAAALAGRAIPVRGLARGEKPAPAPGVEIVRGDIRDRPLLAAAFRGVDVVYHCAAALGASGFDEREFRSVNAEGTQAVIEAAAEAGVRRVVHFSSAGVLGHLRENRPADEDHPLNPRDAYDRTKLEGERIAAEAARRGRDVVIVRPGWAYGPGDRRTFKLIRAIARRRFLLVGKGRTLQTPVFVDDLVEGALLCAEKGRSGEVYHLAGGEALTVREIAAAIAAAAGVGIPRVRLPLPPVRFAAAVLGGAFRVVGKEAPLNPSRLAFFVHPKPLGISKARRELGYDPKMAFREGMARTIAWYRLAGWL